MKQYRVRFAAVCICALLLAAAVSFAAVYHRSAAAAAELSQAPFTVIVDAGHGDFDPGALGADGTQEKVLNLEIALKLCDMLRMLGFHVVSTRSGDETLAAEDAVSIAAKKRTDTHARAALAESYADCVYLSIHLNAFSDRAQNGAQLFYGTLDERSELLCECIQASFVRLLQPQNKRQVKQGTDSVYLLTHTKAPIALVECGFITNEQELQLLKSDAYQQKVAFAICAGLCDYLEALSLQNEA